MFNKKQRFISEIFSQNKRNLLGFLIRKVGRDAATDLLQETFLRFLQHPQLEAVANPPAFLQQIALNLTRDFARRRKTEAIHLEFGACSHDVASPEALPEERIAHEQKSRLLRAAAEALPPRCREVLLMSMFEDVPLDEVAKRLDISRNMVDKHMRIALHRLRAALD
ncbi:MAG TPA: RNA polymerase sigma factor [Methylocella sp.]|nr:RNA polymerase sigma factor [Methylocella sp.]